MDQVTHDLLCHCSVKAMKDDQILQISNMIEGKYLHNDMTKQIIAPYDELKY
jgi:hypothetical protein